MALTVNKLHTHFFAEVSGVDLTSSFSDDTLVEILEAFSQHSVLLFRDQDFGRSRTMPVVFHDQNLSGLMRISFVFRH